MPRGPRRGEDADRVGGEGVGELLRREAEHVLQHERRGPDVGEEHAADTGDGRDIGEEAASAQDRGQVAQDGSEVGRDPPVGGQRLRDEAPADRCEKYGDHGEEQEHPAPRHHVRQQTAGDRRHDWHQRCHRSERGESAGGGRAWVHVRNDRAAHDDAGGRRESCHEPDQQQRPDVRCDGAQHVGDGVPDCAEQERSATSHGVAERADDDLPERDPDEDG